MRRIKFLSHLLLVTFSISTFIIEAGFAQAQKEDPSLPAQLKSPPPNLFTAAMKGELAGVQAALSSGANIDETDQGLTQFGLTPLMFAAAHGRVEIVNCLLSQGAKVDTRSKAGDLTALMLASAATYTEVVELLLNKGANKKAQSTGGLTPLMFAACGRPLTTSSHLATVEFLLKRG